MEGGLPGPGVSGSRLLSRGRALLGRALSWVLDLVYPARCGSCGVPLPPGNEVEFCEECLKRLPWHSGCQCPVCGRKARRGKIESGDGSAPPECVRCRKSLPAFSMARSAFRFEGAIRDAIHQFKFEGRHSLARTLSCLMWEGLSRQRDFFEKADLIVPVPLHEERRRERGYDQARSLARFLSAMSGIPLERDALLRARATRAQVGLNLTQRRMNVRDAFVARDDRNLEGKTVLLVDDVMTTGATVDSSAQALLKAGAREVRVATIARD